MATSIDLPRYNRRQAYQWNYDHAPVPVDIEVPALPGSWDFCGLAVDSPLGIPAGPLLNGRWCLYYASLGFDVLTYKTVRSRERPCYDLPNLQPVDCGALGGGESDLRAVAEMRGSWAVSFGMPSKQPELWRADIQRTRERLPEGKLLSVSVVGTVQNGWSIDDLADDYARCAKWALESGADCIETNFSCPNVSTCDGQLYQQPADAAQVAARVRQEIGRAPFIVKIGYLANRDDALALLQALDGTVDALAMTNSIATTVVDAAGRRLFAGEKRGICGDAIRQASVDQTKMVADLAGRHGIDVQLIGVGGASAAKHVREYLQAGANAVHIATAAMANPAVGIVIRRQLAVEPS